MTGFAARRLWLCVAVLALCGAACAQMPIGSVSTLDATVTGASSVANERAQIGTNGTVVANDHAAYVQLFRGGSLKVCATSGVHLTAGISVPDGASVSPVPPAAASPAGPSAPPMMVALDRGAIELHTTANASDILMTPDLRLSFSDAGPLDLRVRVGRNGDTCVENRITGVLKHPALKVNSLFGSDSYDVLPGQHVLFEKANLHEVVDNESSPCGCPEPAIRPQTSETDSSLLKPTPRKPLPAAVAHPFPTAVSQGLEPPPPVPPAPPQTSPSPVATPLVYTGDSRASAPKPSPPEQKKGLFHSIGRFFKRIF
jgi:hypothetical protein